MHLPGGELKLRVGTVERGGEIRNSLEQAEPGTSSVAQVRATLQGNQLEAMRGSAGGFQGPVLQAVRLVNPKVGLV